MTPQLPRVRRRAVLAGLLSASVLLPAGTVLARTVPATGPTPARVSTSASGSTAQKPTQDPKEDPKANTGPGRFTMVGHEPLFGRGMNAALAVFGNTVYVGNRTDTSPGHKRPGILVVDAKNPAKPVVVNEVLEGQTGVASTSRELRVWPQQKLLMVMNFQCSALLHRCASPSEVNGSLESAIRFYDLANPLMPKLISTYVTPRTPHEMHLWLDPTRADRALLYYSTPTTSLTLPNMIVTDISKARQGVFTELGRFNANAAFPAADRSADDVRLHSMATTADGMRTHVAYLGGGYLLLDTSDFARGLANPEFRLLTPVVKRVHWGSPGAHSAVEIPQRPDLALATDEVYGKFGGVLADHGCPWGWVRIIDNKVLDSPKVLAEYKLKENTEAFCTTQTDRRTENFTSFSAHNPTVVSSDLALVTWHGKGLQAIDLRNPAKPVSAGEWIPSDPLATVATEDPALGGGNVDNVAGGTRDKVIMWSFPVVVNGLIYVVDLRNGLYILKYDGELSPAVKKTVFLEGNSNVGQVLAAQGARPAKKR